MSTILFVDPACPRPYGADLDGQRVRGLGGTEGTVARLTRVPETFGLVFGESHAVGTPVLAHHFGAAPEMLSPAEVLDARNLDAVTNRLADWCRNGRPTVAARPEYLIAEVARRWTELFNRG
jgi:glycosyltransferase involved in cell wall biosynthesis